MAELKTKPTDDNVVEFLSGVEDEKKRRDSFTILELMKQLSGAEPKMWGSSIVGFGDYHYKYASGAENDWFKVGFSPRKQNLTLYIMGGFNQFGELLAKLGKYKTGKGCLYVNKMEDIDQSVLKEMIRKSLENMENPDA